MSMSSERHWGTGETRSTVSVNDSHDHGNDLRHAAATSASRTSRTQPRTVPAPVFGLTITGLYVLGAVLMLGGLFVVVSAQPTALGDVVIGGVLMVNGFSTLLAATVIAVLRRR